MTLSDDMALLSGVALFNELGEDKLRLLAFGAERRRLEAGEVLFSEGALADCAYVVANGRFELTRRIKGESKSIGIAGPQTLLGEMAMISAIERKMTAVALEPAEVIRINRALFRRMLEEFPEIASLMQQRIEAGFKAMISDLNKLAPRFGV